MSATKSTAVVVIAQFHKDVYALTTAGARASQTMAQKLNALLTATYGAVSPTYEQYRADQAALAKLAKDRKLADNQWVRKPYALAVKTRYGALPVSMDAAAVLKRAQREASEAAAKAAGTAGKVGAPAGETQTKAGSEPEMLEALITRVGLFKCLDACIAILAADDTTKAQAAHLAKQAHKAAELAANGLAGAAKKAA